MTSDMRMSRRSALKAGAALAAGTAAGDGFSGRIEDLAADRSGLRGTGGGNRSRPSIPPGRGEVSANSFSQTAMWASASMPRMISPNRATHSQIRGIGAPWISP